LRHHITQFTGVDHTLLHVCADRTVDQRRSR
jgi:hypothetical protein